MWEERSGGALIVVEMTLKRVRRRRRIKENIVARLVCRDDRRTKAVID
jgi:hypothetical protein